jgi:hypothetical protein
MKKWFSYLPLFHFQHCLFLYAVKFALSLVRRKEFSKLLFFIESFNFWNYFHWDHILNREDISSSSFDVAFYHPLFCIVSDVSVLFSYLCVDIVICHPDAHIGYFKIPLFFDYQQFDYGMPRFFSLCVLGFCICSLVSSINLKNSRVLPHIILLPVFRDFNVMFQMH